jgi:hypothetical protein
MVFRAIYIFNNKAFFITIKMCTGILTWSIGTCAALFITQLIIHKMRQENKLLNKISPSYDRLSKNELAYIKCLLNRAFSFFVIVDSKFIGLAIFMISNYITGLMNLFIDLAQLDVVQANLILIVGSLFFTFIPFLVYYVKIVKKKKSKEDFIKIHV